METIRKIIIAIVYLSLGFSFAYGQDTGEILDAFSESYELEGEGDFLGAADKIKEVYDESSYEMNARLGWLNYEMGSFTESTAFYQKAIALKPYALEPKFGIILPLSALGNWTYVIGHYQDILEIDPRNTTALYRLGLIYYGKEQYEDASKLLEKVINLYPFDYDTMILYAWSQFKMGNMREAKILFNKCLIIKPGDASAEEGLSLIK